MASERKAKVRCLLFLSLPEKTIQLTASSPVYVQAYNDKALKTITEQSAALRSLGGRGIASLEVLPPSDARPAGCVVFPVSSATAVFVLVKGRVDLDGEIDKARKKLDKAAGFVAKQEKLLGDPAWAAKAPEATKEVERKKLDDLQSQVAGFQATIKQFEQLKLE